MVVPGSESRMAGMKLGTAGAAPWIVALELSVMFLAATLPTPLYPLYRQTFGFGGITLTLIYAVYVLGNLTALLFFGRLSDQAGRLRATRPAIIVAIISTLTFLFAQATGWLFVARGLSGFATGLASGAATAWIMELLPEDRKRQASAMASSANFAGLALAPLLSGALAQLAPAPLRLAYLLLLVLLMGIAVGIGWAPETVKDPRHHLSELSFQPRLGLPQEIRTEFVAPAITGFVTFALLGFYAALIPNLLARSMGETSPLLAGAVVCELFAIGTLAAILAGRLRPRPTMLSGLALLVPGLGLLVLAQVLSALWLLFVATAIGGIAAGFGYSGSLEVINTIAPEEKRGEVVSSYLVTLYLGNSLPVIGVGLLTAAAGSLVAHAVFAIIIALMACAALIFGARHAPQHSSRGIC